MNPNKPNETDQQKATECILKYFPFIRLVAFETAPSSDLTDDIANDVFVYFVDHADRWDYNRDLKPLFRQITRNMAMRQWREFLKNQPAALQRVYESIQKVRSEQKSPEDIMELDRRTTALELCMKKLAPEYRALVEAHYFGGAKLTEMSEEQNIKLGTLQKKMCRIRLALRDCVHKSLQEGTLHVE